MRAGGRAGGRRPEPGLLVTISESFRLPSGTVVVGIGNTILSDDGAGVHAARMLQADVRMPAGATILDGGTLGLALAPYLSEASRVLLLDAADSGAAPGTLTHMTGAELLASAGGRSVHSLGVADLVAALALMSAGPQEIILLGVQPSNTHCGTSLSAEVEAALPRLVEAALAQLALWAESSGSGLDG